MPAATPAPMSSDPTSRAGWPRPAVNPPGGGPGSQPRSGGAGPRGMSASPVPPVHEQVLEAGEILVREGTVDARAFLILDGQAQLFVDGELIATAGPGSAVGELGMLDGQPRSATVRALTPVWLLVVGPQAFASLLQHPAVVASLAEQLAVQRRHGDHGNGTRS